MRIILYGKYDTKVKAQIEAKFIIETVKDGMLEKERLDQLEYDYILITGDHLNEKFIELLDCGVEAFKIRTLSDLTWNRHEVLEQHVYFNELCLDNMRYKGKNKVLMVSQDLAESGAPVALLGMARCLRDMGFCIRVYCQCDGPMKQEFIKLGIPVYIENITNRENLSTWLRVEEFQFAVVNTLLQYKLAYKISEASLNVLWWLHECDNYYASVLEVEGCFPKMNKWIWPVFVGEKVRDSFYRFCMPPKQEAILLYGIQDKYKKRKAVKKDKLTFALVGAIQHRKGQDILLEAVKMLGEAVRDKCKFKIIGISAFPENTLTQQIKAMQHEWKCIEYVEGLSYEEMQNMYLDIDVVVCPSRVDPMPVVVTEGMMYRKTCLVSDEIGNARYIQDGQSGFVVETGNVADLANKIKFIVDNSDSLDKIAENGRKVYEEYFTIEKFYNNVSQLIKRMDKEN